MPTLRDVADWRWPSEYTRQRAFIGRNDLSRAHHALAVDALGDVDAASMGDDRWPRAGIRDSHQAFSGTETEGIEAIVLGERPARRLTSSRSCVSRR